MKRNGFRPCSAGFMPVLLLCICAGLLSIAVFSGGEKPLVAAPAGQFEIELPNQMPTAESELAIPSPNLNGLDVHVLRPLADNIGFGDVSIRINGEGAAGIFSVNPSERGKRIRIDLKKLPGFQLLPGRNTVEVLATAFNKTVYASFVLSTTSNRLQDFNYQSFSTAGAGQQSVPEIVLLEPEGAIAMPAGKRSMPVLISGIATAATSIARVTVGGNPVPLKRGEQVKVRRLGLLNETNRIAFQLKYTLTAGSNGIPIEAIDDKGNRTQLRIPVQTSDAQSLIEFRGKKYALVVGVSKFQRPSRDLPNLEFADRDARELHEFLQTPGGGKFAPENMLLLTNEQASLDQFKRSLSMFLSKPGPEDLLVIFLATHGGPDPGAPQDRYFILHDTDPTRLSQTALLMTDLQNDLQQNVRAQRLLLLVDTCESAGLMGDPTIARRGAVNNLSNLYLEKLLYREKGRAVITAADVNEGSLEGRRWGNGHGVFTHFLLEGMRGKADDDSDSLITVGELFRFVRQQVRIETNYTQNPRLLVGENENLTIAGVAPAGRKKAGRNSSPAKSPRSRNRAASLRSQAKPPIRQSAKQKAKPVGESRAGGNRYSIVSTCKLTACQSACPSAAF